MTRFPGTQNLARVIPTTTTASLILPLRFRLVKAEAYLQLDQGPLGQPLGSSRDLLSRTQCEPLTLTWPPPS